METSDLPMPPRNIIMVFSTVLLIGSEPETQLEFQIVPDDQVDIANGKYPESAPICQALLGNVLMGRIDTVDLDGNPIRAQIREVGVADGI